MNPISSSMMNAMLQTSVLAVVVPVLAIVIWKMRFRVSLKPFFLGVLFYAAYKGVLVFVNMMASGMFPHMESSHRTSMIMLYLVYQMLVLGILCELVRFAAFRFYLTGVTKAKDAITFGMGFAGAECVATLFVSNILNYVYSSIANNLIDQYGSIDIAASKLGDSSLTGMYDVVCKVRPFSTWMGGWQALSSYGIGIAFTIMIFYGIRLKNKKLVWLSIAGHSIAIIPIALHAKNVLSSNVLTQLIYFALALVIFLYSLKCYRDQQTDDGQVETSAGQTGKAASPKSSIHSIASRNLKDLDEKK